MVVILNGINRPDFSINMSPEEFSLHYWYKEELKQICKAHNLSAYGIKVELEQRIKSFLIGKEVADIRKNHFRERQKVTPKKLTLETKLIPEGFKFNKQARDFFKEYYKVSTFSFTKQMAAALRAAEQKADYSMTVADLIHIYEAGVNSETREKISIAADKTYQWNNFVKDFHKDERTKGMQNKLKVVSRLWQQVKYNPGPKVYHQELLTKYLNNHVESNRGV